MERWKGMATAYWFAPRPSDSGHRHPFLVFDCQDRLHFELTVFGKEAVARVQQKTVEGYFRALLPFFTYLETDEWQVRAGRCWNEAPSRVQKVVADYLVQILHCIVRKHTYGFHLVSSIERTPPAVRSFLSGLKFFYQVMCQQGFYRYSNPLVDPGSTIMRVIEPPETEARAFPRMPEISGVTQPAPKRKPRLSDSYFKLEDEEWIPQIVDDPTLFARILKGGRMLPNWRLREECANLARGYLAAACNIVCQKTSLK